MSKEHEQKYWYFYLHVNGDIIGKNPYAVDSVGPYEYFDSDFVRKWWRLNLTERKEAWNFLLDILRMGGSVSRIIELADLWKCDKKDLPNFLMSTPNPTEQQRKDLKLFIKKVLGEEDNDDFWNSLKDPNLSRVN